MGGCTVFGCTNRSEKGFRLYRFPQTQQKYIKWLDIITEFQPKSWTIKPNSRICAAHFEENQFELKRKDGKKKLKPNAIPTIFHNSEVINKKQLIEKNDIFYLQNSSNEIPSLNILKDQTFSEWPTCRLCLKKVNLFTILFKKEENNLNLTFAEILEECFQIKASKNDGYPENICYFCVKKLIESYEFRKVCKINEDILKNNQNYYKNDTFSNLSDKTISLEKMYKDQTETSISVSFPSRCHECSHPVENFDKLREHLKEVHINLKYCEFCCQTFTCKRNLIRHIASKHESKTYICPECGIQLSHPDLRFRHQKHHLFKKYSCSICSIKFSFKVELRKHNLENHFSKKIACLQCSESFATKKTLKSHIIKYHFDKFLKDMNDKYDNQEISKLLKRTRGPYSTICICCNQDLVSHKNLRQHIKNDHSDGVCKFCNKKFINYRKLRMHVIWVHRKTMSILCNKCGQKFSQLSLLNRHNILKHSEKTIHCDQCDKKFYFITQLKYHQRRCHSLNEEYICGICASTFSSSEEIIEHLKSHSEINDE